jgi:hypothetical protein
MHDDLREKVASAIEAAYFEDTGKGVSFALMAANRILTIPEIAEGLRSLPPFLVFGKEGRDDQRRSRRYYTSQTQPSPLEGGPTGRRPSLPEGGADA